MKVTHFQQKPFVAKRIAARNLFCSRALRDHGRPDIQSTKKQRERGRWVQIHLCAAHVCKIKSVSLHALCLCTLSNIISHIDEVLTTSGFVSVPGQHRQLPIYCIAAHVGEKVQQLAHIWRRTPGSQHRPGQTMQVIRLEKELFCKQYMIDSSVSPIVRIGSKSHWTRVL